MSRGLGIVCRIVPVLLLLSVGSLPLLADPAPPSPEQVQNAITKAQQFLLSKQNNGSWDSVAARSHDPLVGGANMTGGQFGGLTALATYALLDSGTPAQDPHIKEAVEFLKQADMVGVYALGLRCQVWHLIPQDAAVRACVKRDATLLVEGMKTNGPGAGLYNYTTDDGPDSGVGRTDHSVSQYAVLGMWACAQDGLEVPKKFWTAMDSAWRKDQLTDGGWDYGRDPANPAWISSTVPMTAAGVASLFITWDQLNFGNVACNGNRTDPQIERGLEWLGEHFDEFGASGHAPYGLYGIERIGVASGRKYLGKANWFERGAKFFVEHQQPDGAFVGGGEPTVANTAFGLLFLVHGRAPVVLNKLDYRPASEIKSALSATSDVKSSAAWNQRPRDAANLARWMGRQTEEVLNWQVVTLRQSVDDLHDSPLLYVAGNEPIKITHDEEAKLKQFIEEGGLVMFNADCGGGGFTESVRKLAARMFSGEFMTIPQTHPIFTDEQYLRKKWKNTPEVLGLSNGVRELMVLIPHADLAKGWQADNYLVHPEQFQLPADIFLYGIDEKNLRMKGQTYIVRPNPDIHPAKTIKLARLQYASAWDPEPGGWRRLAAVMHNSQDTNLAVETIKLGDKKLAGQKIAHLTGAVKFQLSDAERKDIKSFVEGGGTLIVDSAGGVSDFSQSAESELRTMFPTAIGLGTPLPPEHPLYTQTGEKLDKFTWRRFARKTLPSSAKLPRIQGLTINGRLAVFYSAEDLSGGLVGEDIDGINGYEPQTATAIMSHILKFANK